MKACALTVVVACLLSSAALAGDGLELEVLLASGTPLAGARVSVIGRPGSVVADGDGRCVLQPTPEPPFVLFVARPDGVALKPVPVTDLPAEGPLRVTVAAMAETVTVVSGVIPDLELPPAVASTVIGRTDLVQRQPDTLTAVLETVPGVNRGGEGRSVVPGLRGLPKHRTLILLDDGRVTAERRAGPSATFLDPETLDEVEVVRGPGSVAYGSDAFGGIIRARSRMPETRPAPSVTYSLRGSTAGDEWGAVADVVVPAFGGGLLLGGQTREADDYSSPEGEVFNTAWSTRGFRAAWQGVLGPGVLHVGWRTDLARDVGKPAPDSREVRVLYPEEDSHRFNIGFEAPGPGAWSRLAASLAWDDYQLVLDKDRVATDIEPRSVTRSDVRSSDYELRLEAERPLGEWRLVLGAHGFGRFGLEAVESTLEPSPCCGALVPVTSVPSIVDARRDDLGLFAAAGRRVGRWSVDAGVRGDSVRSENTGGYFGDRSSSSSALSGFVGAGVDLGPDLRLTYQVARGFRDALLSDRYYRGETGRGFITGNPDLEPETSLQHDLALRWRRGPGQVAAYAYLYRIDDLIERFKTDGEYFFRNRGSAEVKGVEVEGTLELGAGVELNLGGQWARGEVRDDGAPLDDVPPLGGFVVVRGRPSARWWWMARGSVVARLDRPGPSEQEVPSHGVLDAAVGWRFSDALRLEVLGRNLLDEAYLGSADESAVLAPGRSLSVSLRGEL